jgi:hypothetical protein
MYSMCAWTEYQSFIVWLSVWAIESFDVQVYYLDSLAVTLYCWLRLLHLWVLGIYFVHIWWLPLSSTYIVQ